MPTLSKKNGIFEYEYRIIRPDKQIRWLHSKSMPVVNDKGEIIRRVGLARDITRQKESQEATNLLAEMLDVALTQSQCMIIQVPSLLIKTFEFMGTPVKNL
ncbi:MAG: PAS domain-containing protein [Bacteroidales bacterium]|nr:PAS domain-containing protein [Bacteroidales bacterium]